MSGKRVEVDPFRQDRYKRLGGIVYLRELNVNAELIRKGHAEAYRQYMRKADAKGPKRIPPTASAYSFRHARINELLQVHGVDPLTVASQDRYVSGGYRKEFTYAFIPSAMQEKLAAVRDTTE